MNDDDIYLEDWRETKSEIKHFDDVVMRTRLEGIPIAISIIGAALLAKGTLTLAPLSIGSVSLNVTALIVVGGLIYLTSVVLLDALHYRLLLRAVNHARGIEKRKEFVGKLSITQALHGNRLTTLHNVGGILTYVSVYVFGFFLLIAGI